MRLLFRQLHEISNLQYGTLIEPQQREEPMHTIESRLVSVRNRQQWQWLWYCVSRGLVLGGAVGLSLAVLALLGVHSLGPWILAATVAGPLAGALYAWVKSRSVRGAAVAVDRAYALKDRAITAWTFLNQPQEDTTWRRLQLADAESHLCAVQPETVAPISAPRAWYWGLALNVIAILVSFWAVRPETATASLVRHDAVVASAERVEKGLQELKQLIQEEPDAEIEKLLKQLAKQVELMKKPGMDPKEALATLSEMQSALEAKQNEIASPKTEAELREIGEILKLAEPFQAAAGAMSAGEHEKAARELEKLDLPKLDRQTERSLLEKLQKAAKESKSRLRDPLQKAAQGMIQGNRNRFRDGMKGLAGECRAQGNRNKLINLLRKQCQCMGECKSECAGSCRSETARGPGGTNWGLGAAGKEPGDKTARLGAKHELNLKGQQSESGDSDTETIDGPEEQQEAVRTYREQAKKYEQLSESVLDSEPIPLGHRQTIRRYFELIRPQESKAEAGAAQP